MHVSSMHVTIDHIYPSIPSVGLEPEVLCAVDDAQQVLIGVEVQRRRLPARPHVADRVAALRRTEAGRKPRGHGLSRLYPDEVLEQLGQ